MQTLEMSQILPDEVGKCIQGQRMTCTKVLRQERHCGEKGARVETGKIDGHQFVKVVKGNG